MILGLIYTFVDEWVIGSQYLIGTEAMKNSQSLPTSDDVAER